MKSPCRVCNHPDGRLRCVRCQSAYYCSVKCQRIDWKKGNHRKACQALIELQSHSQQGKHSSNPNHNNDVPMTILQQEYHKALYMIDQIKEHERSTIETNKINETKRRNTPKHKHESTMPTTTKTSFPHFGRIHQIDANWSFTVEIMPRISTYQIIFQHTTPDNSQQSFVPQLSVSQRHTDIQILLSSNDNTPITIQNFPYTILQQQARIHAMEDATTPNQYWIFTLPYDNPDPTDEMDDDFTSSQSLFDAIATLHGAPHNVATALACNSCRAPLFTNTAAEAITSLFPAPSDRWEDLQDYIACGTQQNATSLFGQAIEQRQDIMLHDATTLSLSIHQPTTTCAMNIPNYGCAEPFEMSKPSTGSANNSLSAIDDSGLPRETTLTCQYCMATLGSATATQQRLLLHRLALRTAPLSRISRFIASVMIEQAESKAVFALRVLYNDDTIAHHQRHSLILRLVGWDSFSAVGDSATVTTIQDVCDAMSATTTTSESPLHVFDATNVRRTAKLLFTTEPVSSNKDETQLHATLDWTQWTRLDPCCSPDADSTENKSSDLLLPCLYLGGDDEFRRLELELAEASALIPEDVVHATVTAKLSGIADASSTRMAAIAL